MIRSPLSSTCLWHVDRGPTRLGQPAGPLYLSSTCPWHVDCGPPRLGQPAWRLVVSPAWPLARSFSFAGVVGGDGLGQRRDSVLPRDDGCLDAEDARGIPRHGADAGDGDAGEQPGQVRCAKEAGEVAHGGGAREGDDVHAPLGERAAQLSRILGGRARRVGGDLLDPCPCGLELAHEHVAGFRRAGEEHALPGLEEVSQALREAFRHVFFRHHLGLEAKRPQRFRRGGSDGGKAEPIEGPGAAAQMLETPARHLHAIDAGEDRPLIVVDPAEGAIQRGPGHGRLYDDGRSQENGRARILEQRGEAPRLGAGSRHHYHATGQRPGGGDRHYGFSGSRKARAPRARRLSASRSPTDSGSAATPDARPRITVRPSTLETRPSISRAESRTWARPATGVWQPAPRRRRKARSASASALAVASSMPWSASSTARSVTRASTPRIPCPTAGRNPSAERIWTCSSLRPSRSRPARAMTMAS